MNIRLSNILLGVLIALGSIVAICFIVVFFIVESYFYPAPYISTEFTQGFSWEAYESVQIGMTKEEVTMLLSEPFKKLGYAL